MNRSKRKSLRMENLEQRELLAGDVTASVSNGTLKVIGDGAGNGVLISEITDGEYAIVGLDHDGSATRINGADEIVLSGVTLDVDVRLNGGHDKLVMNNSRTTDQQYYPEGGLLPDHADIPRDLKIYAHAGNDRIELSSLRVHDDLMTYTHDGADVVNFSNLIVTDNLTVSTSGKLSDGADEISMVSVFVDGQAAIWTGDGADSVSLNAQNRIKESLNIDTGSGGDTVNVTDTSVWYRHLTVGQDFTVTTGEGDDTVSLQNVQAEKDVAITTGDGQDRVVLNELTVGFHREVYLTDVMNTGALTIETGAGRDSVDVINTHVANDLTIDVGEGDNIAGIFETTAGKPYEGTGSSQAATMTVRSGSGRDSVTFSRSHATDAIMTELGAGNDRLLVQFCSAENGTFDLGAGRDSYNFWQNDFEHETVINPRFLAIGLPIWP